jgi:hypothetical protein
MALLALILVLHTRKKISRSGEFGFQPSSISSCVGVWQNDRVEIIANDRECRVPVPYKIHYCCSQREIGQRLPMLPSPLRSV